MKLEGSLQNRLAEGRNFTGRELREGDDITMYYYSDCTCYYITKVISQKEIQVKKYYVCADHSKPGGMGHQNWLYFKTLKEQNQYLNSVFHDRDLDENPVESEPSTWVLRYGSWKERVSWTYQSLKTWYESRYKPEYFQEYIERRFNKKEQQKLLNGGVAYQYYDLPAKISFGVRSYYYDWEF